MPENVFRVPSRINSTWGAHIVDMLRATDMLEVIERDALVDNAERMGRRLLDGLQRLAQRHPEMVARVRGRGLMCAFDLPTGEIRDRTVRGCLKDGMIVLPCGKVSVRFRPSLIITEGEIDEALERLERPDAGTSGAGVRRGSTGGLGDLSGGRRCD